MFDFASYNSTPYQLSCNPDFGGKEGQEDSVIRSPFEGGYVQTRPRFTRVRKTFSLTYPMLTDTDKGTIESLYAAVNGGDSFTYIHYVSATNYTVRFSKPPEFTWVSFGFWSSTIEMEEV